MKLDLENKRDKLETEQFETPFDVLLYTDPELRRPCSKVKFIDEESRRIIEDMAETMIIQRGIGLAAPQVGIFRRFFLFIPNPDDMAESKEIEVKVAINPQILEREGESVSYEGCLSYPEHEAKVKRAIRIKVRYHDMDMKKVEEEYLGLAARVFQHELDHLDGILFIDRMEPETLRHVEEPSDAEKNKDETDNKDE